MIRVENRPEQAWVVELHPKGGSRFRLAEEMMQDNLEIYAKGQRPVWVAVAIRPTLDEAKRELARVRKNLTAGHDAENTRKNLTTDGHG
jgi:hypothetical protein